MIDVKKIIEQVKALEPVPGVTSLLVSMTPKIAASLLRDAPYYMHCETLVRKYTYEINNNEASAKMGVVGVCEKNISVNGRHRLMAVVESGKTVPMVIHFGPAEFVLEADQNSNRV